MIIYVVEHKYGSREAPSYYFTSKAAAMEKEEKLNKGSTYQDYFVDVIDVDDQE